jgi:hypothetical protein
VVLWFRSVILLVHILLFHYKRQLTYWQKYNNLSKSEDSVIAIGVRGKLEYDKEKYKEMLLDAAETVLGYFGFDRTFYGNRRNTARRKWRWLEELRQEREKDIRIEMGNQ